MCEFIKDCNSKCGCKTKYGNYCTKHKRNHLVQNDFITYEYFTNKPSDYLKGDILKTLNYLDNKKYNKSLKKEVLFTILTNKYSKFSHYNNNKEPILKVQRYYRQKYKLFNSRMRGLGFLNKDLCNNQEDFFTYETINEIDDKYFFSYKDEKNILWFFDIRSFTKLVEMNQPNPYTMVPFNNETLYKSNKLVEYLKSKNISMNFVDEMKELKKDKKNILKQKIIDLSAILERLGYSFNVEWFKSLHTLQLKKLYYILEDIWNFRAGLTPDSKRRICPPNGVVFNKSQHEIRNINSKDTMRDIIVSDVLKFDSAQDDNDKKLGYIYFLMGLALINPVVYETHSWILNMI